MKLPVLDLERKPFRMFKLKRVHKIFQIDRVQTQTRALTKISSPLPFSHNRKLTKKIQFKFLGDFFHVHH